jgi:hypothetical protein
MSRHHDNGGWTTADRNRTRPILEAQVAAGRVCIDCGKPIYPGQKWQVGHIVSKAEAKRLGWSNAMSNDLSNLGPSHTKGRGQQACNQRAGGQLARRIQLGQKLSGGWSVDW